MKKSSRLLVSLFSLAASIAIILYLNIVSRFEIDKSRGSYEQPAIRMQGFPFTAVSHGCAFVFGTKGTSPTELEIQNMRAQFPQFEYYKNYGCLIMEGPMVVNFRMIAMNVLIGVALVFCSVFFTYKFLPA